jgi:hypothetical protein
LNRFSTANDFDYSEYLKISTLLSFRLQIITEAAVILIKSAVVSMKSALFLSLLGLAAAWPDLGFLNTRDVQEVFEIARVNNSVDASPASAMNPFGISERTVGASGDISHLLVARQRTCPTGTSQSCSSYWQSLMCRY